eukprot:CAMPEP_0180786364 /NCGR_PEP_ID=MMETSP1038_2-20121128/50755_1 /TAXON_ID=632150 /ORGANISM="Azadinium spinosum, Strain 3D9" /LENGTH=347 /DNA_ID=CAMNT_0022823469 /DNA_START=187 /DNA_END=1227 /DNA_ORIENTATION=-
MTLGLLIGIMNGILYFFVDRASRRVGFQWKGEIDVCNLVGGVLIVGVNTAFNLAVSLFAFGATQGKLEVHDGSERVVYEELFRRRLARHLWRLLVPGVLILPDLLYPLYKYALSLNAFLAYWISIPLWPVYSTRDLRSDPNVKPQAAEKGLEPAAMQIEFDYANAVCLASTAFVLFFVEAGYAAAACAVLVVWAIFTYQCQRYCHLRLNKLVDYTTPLLADCFSVLWGIPLSIVACAAACWAVRSGDLAVGSEYIAFLVALGTYWLGLCAVLYSVSPHSDNDTEGYAGTRQTLRYDYFNTNPVHVLKALYLGEGPAALKGKEAASIVYFQRGKEYLQIQRVPGRGRG